jgi:hypothetical protein
MNCKNRYRYQACQAIFTELSSMHSFWRCRLQYLHASEWSIGGIPQPSSLPTWCIATKYVWGEEGFGSVASLIVCAPAGANNAYQRSPTPSASTAPKTLLRIKISTEGQANALQRKISSFIRQPQLLSISLFSTISR